MGFAQSFNGYLTYPDTDISNQCLVVQGTQRCRKARCTTPYAAAAQANAPDTPPVIRRPGGHAPRRERPRFRAEANNPPPPAANN